MRKVLHILQGDTERDKESIERAARRRMRLPKWVAPKSAELGDDVVIYIGNFGFFATAIVDSTPRRRPDWSNRYGAALGNVRLIQPAISLGAVKRSVPNLIWAKYPRSITTPSQHIADQVRRLIAQRRKTRLPDLNEEAVLSSNLDELRAVALMKSGTTAAKKGTRIYRVRDLAIRQYVLMRAAGTCEGCGAESPFVRRDGSPYLEPHHTTRLADEGLDHLAHVIGLCPNCHRRAHHADDGVAFNNRLKEILRRKERAKRS